MPFVKKGNPAADAAATIEAQRTEPTGAVLRSMPKGRDFDAEARGKTRCALEEAWAQSPLLPMLIQDPSDRAALHTLLDELVTERMKRVFPNG